MTLLDWIVMVLGISLIAWINWYFFAGSKGPSVGLRRGDRKAG
jgi:hypothetical protein